MRQCLSDWSIKNYRVERYYCLIDNRHA
ncbi:hypothetical protein OA791_09020 [Citrobacter portucalensis]|nr:hypothetical protein [Citrobacter portucalensis]MCR3698892.1 hypothetical protein [Citrobacter portucalensis]MCX8976053.1 hypothetical protein [Citrobacter portucalensis]MDG9958165.1 hypothetical protein [Citrobacter portucalensis]MDN4358280.1 hypothetical protein [Citrobacter portucalensis]MDN4372542.1 hypothetical protein [Citrobacter portucalensis]